MTSPAPTSEAPDPARMAPASYRQDIVQALCLYPPERRREVAEHVFREQSCRCRSGFQVGNELFANVVHPGFVHRLPRSRARNEVVGVIPYYAGLASLDATAWWS